MDNPVTHIRQLKIDLITGEPNVYNNWFNSIWENIHIMEINTKHAKNILYYYKSISTEKIPLFFLDPLTNNWYYDYSFFYRRLIKLGFNYELISELTTVVEILLSSLMPNIIITSLEYANLNDFIMVKEALV